MNLSPDVCGNKSSSCGPLDPAVHGCVCMRGSNTPSLCWLQPRLRRAVWWIHPYWPRAALKQIRRIFYETIHPVSTYHTRLLFFSLVSSEFSAFSQYEERPRLTEIVSCRLLLLTNVAKPGHTHAHTHTHTHTHTRPLRYLQHVTPRCVNYLVFSGVVERSSAQPRRLFLSPC